MCADVVIYADAELYAAGACDGVSTRYPGYNIQPGSILESIPHVQYEEECLNYCVVEPACKSAVHLSGTQTCHLKRVAPAVPRNLNDPNLVGGTLERFVSLVCAEPQFTCAPLCHPVRV